MLIIEIHVEPIQEKTSPTQSEEIIGMSAALPLVEDLDRVRKFIKTLASWWQSNQSYTHIGNGFLL